MTYEELLISIDLNGYENVLLSVGKTYFDDSHWFVVCDDGDCHLFDRYGNEDDISKVITIYEDMIPKDIKKIIIPDSVISIKDYTFDWCRGLTNVTIPESVTSIGNGAFRYCSELTSVIIPESVTSIRYNAFSSCSRLTHVTIPNNVTNIDDSAFYGCNMLISAKIPDSITSIGNWAFIGCNRLTSIKIPDNIISIESGVFDYCSNLKSLIFKGKSFDQVRLMKNYPFGIEDESIIKCIC